MSIELHAAIEGYFAAANAHDAEAMLRVFAPDARVVDERKDRCGHEAIRTWETETFVQYQPYHEPLSVEQVEDETVVMAQVSGNFTGSPVVLRFRFHLTGNVISRLEITTS